MIANQLQDLHEQHLNDAKENLLKKGDLYHEIVFFKEGRKQMLVLVPFGPTRASQAAAEAIIETDRPDVMSVASLLWVKAFPKRPENYRLGDVGNSVDRRELLVVVTACRRERISTVSEVIRDETGIRLKASSFEVPKGMLVPEMIFETRSS